MSRPYADHTWFDFRCAASAPILRWDEPVQVAVHLVVALQSFPLAFKPPFPVPGGLERPYPDLSNWSQRKLGQREGLERVLDLLDAIQTAATWVLDAQSCEETSVHHQRLMRSGFSFAASGMNAGLLHSQFTDPDAEASMVRDVLSQIQSGHGFDVQGWRPPSGAHSPATLDVLASSGVDTVLDLNNDEFPYRIQTRSGDLLCVPLQHFASDLHCLHVCKQDTEQYVADIEQAIRWLCSEAQGRGPRMLTLPIHPWILGVPHRFRAFERGLRRWRGMAGVRFVHLNEIKRACSALA